MVIIPGFKLDGKSTIVCVIIRVIKRYDLQIISLQGISKFISESEGTEFEPVYA